MKPESKSYRTALGHTRNPPVREVDLEPTGKRGNERENSYDPLLIVSKLTPATSPHPEDTLIDFGVPCQSISKFQEILPYHPNFISLIKTFPFFKLPKAHKFLTGVISGVVTPKDRAELYPLAHQLEKEHYKVC